MAMQMFVKESKDHEVKAAAFGNPFTSDTQLTAFINENSRILGFHQENYESIQQIINEAQDIELIRLFLGIDEINRQPEAEKDMFESSNCAWNDSPFKLAKNLQRVSAVYTPNKIKSDKTLTPIKQRFSAGSPCKKGR